MGDVRRVSEGKYTAYKLDYRYQEEPTRDRPDPAQDVFGLLSKGPKKPVGSAPGTSAERERYTTLHAYAVSVIAANRRSARKHEGRTRTASKVLTVYNLRKSIVNDDHVI